MKKIYEIPEVEIIKANDEQGVFFRNVSKELFNLKLNILVISNVFDFQFIKNGIIFTQTEIGGLFIKKKENKVTVLSGFFYLSFFNRVLSHYVLVRNDSVDDLTNKVVLIDEAFKTITPFKSFRACLNGSFITVEKNELVVFDIELKEKWRKTFCDIDDSLVNNVKFKRKFFEVNKNILVLPTTDGEFLAIEIKNGELIWKYDDLGKISVFKNNIYSIKDYSLKKLNANTGEILKKISLEPLVEAYDFRPTGDHKVYENYIFSMSSGKPGMIAVFDRSTLKFQEMIILEGMIPVGQDNLIWHEGKLFVLDAGKTLHIFE